MKRLFILLAAALLLFVSCGRGGNFRAGENGEYRNRETGITYFEADGVFSAYAAGEEIGTCEKDGKTRTFRAVPGLDSALFLTDGDGSLYLAEGVELTPSGWEISAVHICEEDAVAVEIRRLTAENDAAAIAEISALWFSGAETELPIGERAETSLCLKFAAEEYPNILYSVFFFRYGDGSAYFYQFLTHRAVAVPAALAESILP